MAVLAVAYAATAPQTVIVGPTGVDCRKTAGKTGTPPRTAHGIAWRLSKLRSRRPATSQFRAGDDNTGRAVGDVNSCNVLRQPGERDDRDVRLRRRIAGHAHLATQPPPSRLATSGPADGPSYRRSLPSGTGLDGPCGVNSATASYDVGANFSDASPAAARFPTTSIRPQRYDVKFGR